MKVSKLKLRRILRRTINEAMDPATKRNLDNLEADINNMEQEAMNDHPYVEQAEVEDALLECFLDWVVRSPSDGRQGGDLFDDFVDAVARKIGMPVPDLEDALQNMIYR